MVFLLVGVRCCDSGGAFNTSGRPFVNKITIKNNWLFVVCDTCLSLLLVGMLLLCRGIALVGAEFIAGVLSSKNTTRVLTLSYVRCKFACYKRVAILLFNMVRRRHHISLEKINECASKKRSKGV